MLISAYLFLRKGVNITPIQEEEDKRLCIRKGGFNEEYGVQLSNARSILIGTIGAFIASFWMSALDLLNNLINSTFINSKLDFIQPETTQKAAEAILAMASVATRTDVRSLFMLLDGPDYYLLMKFLPPFVTGYVAFIHIRYLFKKVVQSDSENEKMNSELIGLLMYIKYTFNEMRASGSGRKIMSLLALFTLSFMEIVWHYIFVRAIFFQ